MQEMDRRVGLLRLLLADINSRLKETSEAHQAQRAQLTRIVDFAVRSNVSVTNALAAMAEVEERAAQYQMTARHLTMLRQRVQSELEALLVTRGVAHAHARLAELEARRRVLLAGEDATNAEAPATAPVSSELAEIDAEIAELHATIQTASEIAARTLTEGRHDFGTNGASS